MTELKQLVRAVREYQNDKSLANAAILELALASAEIAIGDRQPIVLTGNAEFIEHNPCTNQRGFVPSPNCGD